MPEPVDVGVLIGGAGAIEQLEALRAVPETRLRAVCGEDAEAREEEKDNHRFPIAAKPQPNLRSAAKESRKP